MNPLRQISRPKSLVCRGRVAAGKFQAAVPQFRRQPVDAGQPRLIDWEYAAVADPLMDLACLVAYYPPVLVHGTALLRRSGLPGSVTLPVLEDLAGVYRLLSNLWYRRLELARRHPPPAH